MNYIQILYCYFQSVIDLLKPQPVIGHHPKYIVSPLLITADAHINLLYTRLK